MVKNDEWNKLEQIELTILERAVELLLTDIEEIYHIEIDFENRMSDIKRYISMLQEEVGE